ncbi:hypothetical protein BDZ94DRAFT_1156655, partial [Collybia nuda]
LKQTNKAANMVLGLSPNTYSILGTASARVYHAQNLRGSEWCYSRLKGTLVFGKNIVASDSVDDGENHWFRLLDVNSGKAIWMFQVPSGLAYQQDRPFFHIFQGRSRRFGFLFEDDDEAAEFANIVIAETRPPWFRLKKVPLTYYLSVIPKGRSRSLSAKSKPVSRSRSTISPSMVSAPTPNSFVHISHVGINKEGDVEASPGIDPSWKTTLSGLQTYSKVGEATRERVDFSSSFWKGVETHNKASSSETTLTNPPGDDGQFTVSFLCVVLTSFKSYSQAKAEAQDAYSKFY